MALEPIPVGTFLAMLRNQVLETANAAAEVPLKVLSQYLYDIEPVLEELQLQELNGTLAVRIALESVEKDVKWANIVVEKYRNRGRFYLLVKCRQIANEVEEVTRSIGRSLAVLSLANTEVLSRISDQVDRLKNEMLRVEFKASQYQLQILGKLNKGLRELKLNHVFANDTLEEIARAVGVPVFYEISKEVISIKKEKEDAAYWKERSEKLSLEQVIELLFQTNAARDYEGVKKSYFETVQVIERYNLRKKYIQPLNSFFCCITGTIMVDPVSLCTGTTCERSAIEAWFDNGKRTDPETKEVLKDTKLRANVLLRQSIESWRELNYCLTIRSIKESLLSNSNLSVQESLGQVQDLIRENPINKDWIFIGELTDIIIPMLGNSNNRELKIRILNTLKDAVTWHTRNKEKVAESQGWDHIICCLGSDSSISKAAIDLLYELLHDGSCWNVSLCRKLSQQHSALFFLDILRKGPVKESAEIAERILMKLSDTDVHSISSAWRIVGFVSSVVGLVGYAQSSSFKHLFGEWNLLKIFLYVMVSLLVSCMTLFVRTRRISRSAFVKAHVAFVVLMLTSLYSFFYDHFVSEKPDALSLISSGAFALMSLSLSRQTNLGFEMDVFGFWLGFLTLQLMKIRLMLVLVAAVVCYFLILVRSYSNSQPETGTLRVQDYVIINVDTEDGVDRGADMRMQVEKLLQDIKNLFTFDN